MCVYESKTMSVCNDMFPITIVVYKEIVNKLEDHQAVTRQLN